MPAIVSGSSGTAQAKKEALEKVGVRVGRTLQRDGACPRGRPATEKLASFNNLLGR
jgi:succinyl-CoA synthetase alpha subunit